MACESKTELAALCQQLIPQCHFNFRVNLRRLARLLPLLPTYRPYRPYRHLHTRCSCQSLSYLTSAYCQPPGCQHWS